MKIYDVLAKQLRVILLGHIGMREYHVMLPRRQGVVTGSPEFEIVARQFGLGIEQRAGQKYDENRVVSDGNNQAVFGGNFRADEAKPITNSTKLHRRFSTGDGEIKHGIGDTGMCFSLLFFFYNSAFFFVVLFLIASGFFDQKIVKNTEYWLL